MKSIPGMILQNNIDFSYEESSSIGRFIARNCSCKNVARSMERGLVLRRHAPIHGAYSRLQSRATQRETCVKSSC
jgi:hypothetical protein